VSIKTKTKYKFQPDRSHSTCWV